MERYRLEIMEERVRRRIMHIRAENAINSALRISDIEVYNSDNRQSFNVHDYVGHYPNYIIQPNWNVGKIVQITCRSVRIYSVYSDNKNNVEKDNLDKISLYVKDYSNYKNIFNIVNKNNIKKKYNNLNKNNINKKNAHHKCIDRAKAGHFRKYRNKN